MRIVIRQQQVSRLLRWTQRALFAGAATILAYCGFVWLDAWAFQKGQQRELDRLLSARLEATVGQRQAAPPFPMGVLTPSTGGLIGRLEIPRLEVSVMVTEGTGSAELRRAAGHISGTGLPGQPGNIGISGHRDTFFRPLRNIRQDDLITLTTLFGVYRYRVVSTRIVNPHDVKVLDPGADEILTLVTCYPFYFIGAAPSRFIVRAERVAV